MSSPRPLSLLLLFSVLFICAVPGSAWAEDVLDYGPYADLLERRVNAAGAVDYSGLHRSSTDRAILSAFVRAIGAVEPDALQRASRDDQLAFYLNAYNAYVLHDVIRRWPVENVIHEEGFFDGTKHRIAGRSLTLNELEHTEIIRPVFEEPRIHFVLVCAALDCPRLLREPLRASTLEAQLEAAAREFIPAATRLQDDGSVFTSKLFEWFAEDFVASAGSVASYLRRYVSGSLADALRVEDVNIDFAEYDWSINSQ